MSADERLPRVASLPRRGRIDTLLLQATLDRVPPQFVAYVLERSTQSRVAPTRVLPSHPHQQTDNAGHGARSPRPAFGAAIVLLRHQFAVPTQDRIRCRHRGNLTKSPAAELLPLCLLKSPSADPCATRVGSTCAPAGGLAAGRCDLLPPVRSSTQTWMFPLLRAFAAPLPTLFCSRAHLPLENLPLRQQLAILSPRRPPRRPFALHR